MATAQSILTRREPKQQRSRRTVDDVLEAVQLVAKRHGTQAIYHNTHTASPRPPAFRG